MRNDTFAKYHPLINFVYLCMVIIFAMVYFHPVFLAISFVGALCYAVYTGGKKAVKFFLCIPLVMAVLAALINMFLVHKGVTILFYFRDNPVTKEALVYGIATGFMFGAVMMWFYCYDKIMTSDKFMYIFGRIIPSVSLIFSMCLRFVPRFAAQMKIVSNAQKCVGRDVSNGTVRQKLRHGIKILSIMTTWALENAIDTADSMRSRGYGLSGRTNYHDVRFDKRDGMAATAIIFLAGAVIWAGFSGITAFQCYPRITFAETTATSYIAYIAYSLFCFMPMMIDIREELKWKHLQSRI